MKKLVLTLLAMGLFSACSSDKLDEALTRNYETYVGEFKSLGGIEVQDVVTHLFETEDVEILYAYSDRYDLDSEEYFGIEVEAYGVVTTYDNLEKPLFEVKRITDAPEKDDTAVEVTTVSYQDPDFGFSMSYPSNWTLTSNPTSVILEAPVKVEEEGQTGLSPVDSIVVARTDATLVKTSEDTQEDRATEIRAYVVAEYSELATIQSELAYAGPDRLFSVHYKTDDGDTLYFIPRADELFELSYYHESSSDSERLDNSNTFSSLVSGFRFTPYGEGEGVTEEVADEPVVEEPVVEEPVVDEPEVSAPDTEQATFSSYRDLESVPFEFKMSYPGLWYYSGSSTGYIFDIAPIEDGATTGIVTMTFNSGASVGTTRTAESATVTVEVDGRTYTFTGTADYESVMQTMADSIASTKE